MEAVSIRKDRGVSGTGCRQPVRLNPNLYGSFIGWGETIPCDLLSCVLHSSQRNVPVPRSVSAAGFPHRCQTALLGKSLEIRLLGKGTPVLFTAGRSGLIVGKITWGESSDTIELHVPGPDLVLPATPVSTHTVNQPAKQWQRHDRHLPA